MRHDHAVQQHSSRRSLEAAERRFVVVNMAAFHSIAFVLSHALSPSHVTGATPRFFFLISGPRELVLRKARGRLRLVGLSRAFALALRLTYLGRASGTKRLKATPIFSGPTSGRHY